MKSVLTEGFYVGGCLPRVRRYGLSYLRAIEYDHWFNLMINKDHNYLEIIIQFNLLILHFTFKKINILRYKIRVKLVLISVTFFNLWSGPDNSSKCIDDAMTEISSNGVTDRHTEGQIRFQSCLLTTNDVCIFIPAGVVPTSICCTRATCAFLTKNQVSRYIS